MPSYFIRDDMLAALKAYVDRGVPLGDFLRCIVSNNFVEAAGRADFQNYANLQAYAE
jgi:hypothetical protein